MDGRLPEKRAIHNHPEKARDTLRDGVDERPCPGIDALLSEESEGLLDGQ